MADLGCALARGGETSKAALILEQAIAADRALGSTVELTYVGSVLAKCLADLGRIEDARRCLGEAMALAEASGERWWEAELHRVAGEIEAMSPERDAAKAQAHFERALDIARAQKARSFELRAAMCLARLWRDSGRRKQGHDLLAPVYGRFTEGFDTPDLKEAKALLEELA